MTTYTKDNGKNFKSISSTTKMPSYKQLVKDKQNCEVWLNEVNQKLNKMIMQGKQPESNKKMQKTIDEKNGFEASLQRINKQIDFYEQQIREQQERLGVKPTTTTPITPTPITTGAVGEGKRTAGKILIGLGIMITIFSFFGGSVGGGILGFIINIIGIALYASGNRDQGRQTSFFGGGFVSTTGG
jgi:hypothetical protein